MPSISFSSVSFSYTSAHAVIVDASFSLGAGWTGLVGANGSGKSTLLDLMAGTLEPDSGAITIDAAVPAVLCGQSVDLLDDAVREFGGSWEPEDFALRGRLGLEPGHLDRWDTLSPGERKRWQIGAALSGGPDVLLLDEPTNHLDAASRGLLTDALVRHRGLGVVVSHDRALLDDLTDSTLRLTRPRVEHWGAPYGVASGEWRAAEAAEAERHDTLHRQLIRTEERAARDRRSIRDRSAAFERSMRSTGAKDHDAHSTARKERHRSGAATASRSLSSTTSDANRLRRELDSIDVRRQVGGSVAFEGRPAPRSSLVRVSGEVSAGVAPLIEDVDLVVGRHDRIRIDGPNGAGKTTLLTAIAGAWDLPEERILHLPQEWSRREGAAMLDRVRRLPPDVRGRVLQVVARLGADPDLLLASDLPSPGESRKLALAMGIGSETWLLALDEPTNHLDLETVERLEEALAGYPGALVVVSHDATFASRVTSDTWTIERGRLQISRG